MPAPRPEKWETDIEARLRALEQRASRPLSNTGFSCPAPQELIFDGSMHVTGEMDIDGPIDVHGTANFDGDTTIGGNAAITGTLSLPAGIIDNDALANPVAPGQAFQGASLFALSVAGDNIITITKTVPAGFTSAVVNAYGRVAAINSSANKDALYSAVDVNGTGGNQFGNEVAAGDFGSISAGYSTLLTGLTGGASIATHLYASTGLAGWASDPANGADLSVTYLWFR